MKEAPLVSIGLISYNHGKYLKDCLDSIMNQTYRNIELVIINDCSTDKTPQIYQSYMKRLRERFIKVLYMEYSRNTGIECLSKNCNKLVNYSNGKYIKLFATDDIMVNTMIEDEVKYLEYYQEYAMCYAKIQIVNDNYCLGDIVKNTVILPKGENIKKGYGLYKELFINMPINATTAMFRKDIYTKYGGFDEEIQIEDTDFWLRLSIKEGIGYINKILAYHRKGETSISNYNTDAGREKFKFGYRNVTKMYQKHMEYMDKEFAIKILTNLYVYFFSCAISHNFRAEANYLYRKLLKYNIKLTKEQQIQWKLYQFHLGWIIQLISK